MKITVIILGIILLIGFTFRLISFFEFQNWTPQEYKLMAKYGVDPTTEVKQAIRILLNRLEVCNEHRRQT